jgi:hypothetical protein
MQEQDAKTPLPAKSPSMDAESDDEDAAEGDGEGDDEGEDPVDNTGECWWCEAQTTVHACNYCKHLLCFVCSNRQDTTKLESCSGCKTDMHKPHRKSKHFPGRQANQQAKIDQHARNQVNALPAATSTQSDPTPEVNASTIEEAPKEPEEAPSTRTSGGTVAVTQHVQNTANALLAPSTTRLEQVPEVTGITEAPKQAEEVPSTLNKVVTQTDAQQPAKNVIWSSMSPGKEVTALPSAVFVILNCDYQDSLGRSKVLQRIQATLQRVRGECETSQIPIVIATKDYDEHRRWVAACYYDLEAFRCSGLEKLCSADTGEESYSDVNWQVLVANDSPERNSIHEKAFTSLTDQDGVRDHIVCVGSATTSYCYDVDHRLALCLDLLHRFVHSTDGNIWEWIIEEEPQCDLGLMSALSNNAHTYVLDPLGGHAPVLLQQIARNINIIQNIKETQCLFPFNTKPRPDAHLRLCYAHVAKYAAANQVTAHMRQLWAQIRTVRRNSTNAMEAGFEIKKNFMVAKVDLARNVYVTSIRGSLILDSKHRAPGGVLHVRIAQKAVKAHTDAFVFRIAQDCDIHKIKGESEIAGNVRIYLHDVHPGWLEYVLVTTERIKKVTA